MVLSEWLSKNLDPYDNSPVMRYLGEYVIPVAALILALAVIYWQDFAIAAVLVKRLIKRMLA